jgi:hypothetical protein
LQSAFRNVTHANQQKRLEFLSLTHSLVLERENKARAATDFCGPALVRNMAED